MAEDFFKKDAEFVFQNYTRQPLILVSGKGSVVRDIDGKEYIDCVAGVAVNNVGHCHPEVVDAIKKQAETLMHTSNLYYTKPQIELAEKLSKVTGMDRFFFCNSGTEAVEGAMKLARRASSKKDFIAAEGSFHGRTMGSLSLTHNERYRKPFEPLIKNVSFVPFNDVGAIKDKITNDTAAVFLEPIQVESGGINIPKRDDYLCAVREICDEKDVLLIFDEVQTGFGRIGTWFGKDFFKAMPDIMTMAKALGGGFPIGAIAATDNIACKFEPGDHAATFGGNPLACASAIASINVIEKENLVFRAKEIGAYFMDGLSRLSDFETVKDIRGMGLLIGVELSMKGGRIVDSAREKGVLINCISENILRFVPPLVITKEQIDTVISCIEVCLGESYR